MQNTMLQLLVFFAFFCVRQSEAVAKLLTASNSLSVSLFGFFADQHHAKALVDSSPVSFIEHEISIPVATTSLTNGINNS